jgi:hypothetical protein
MSFVISYIPFVRRKISEDDLVDLHGKIVVITGGKSVHSGVTRRVRLLNDL